MTSVIMCQSNYSQANYTRPLIGLERAFDRCGTFTWLEHNWTLCYYFIAAYLVAIFAGQEFMKSRPAFQLRGALLVWNAALAAYSAFGAWRMVSALWYSVREYGFLASVCSPGPDQHRQAVAVWMFLFALSKLVELGDTAFIVLRKTRLIFLHWYHHVTVTFFVWSCGGYPSPMQLHFMTANYTVHAVMYSYYALAVLRVRVPTAVRMAITALQIAQMAFGVLVTGYSYLAKARDPGCMITELGLTIAITIYASYFALFLNFFVRAYLRKGASAGAIISSKKLV